jgi:hypothetical protein
MNGFDLSDVVNSQTTVYKVVDSGLGSASASGDFYVRYRPGEFVKAPTGTKFFVFESLEYAEDFVGRNLRLQIWKATAKRLGRSSEENWRPDPFNRHSRFLADQQSREIVRYIRRSSNSTRHLVG